MRRLGRDRAGVRPGFGVRTSGRLGRGAPEVHAPRCWNAVPRAALRVTAQVESSPPRRFESAESRRRARDAELSRDPTVPGVTLPWFCVSALRPLGREMTLGWPVLDCRLRLSCSVNERKSAFLSCSSARFNPCVYLEVVEMSPDVSSYLYRIEDDI